MNSETGLIRSDDGALSVPSQLAVRALARLDDTGERMAIAIICSGLAKRALQRLEDEGDDPPDPTFLVGPGGDFPEIDQALRSIPPRSEIRLLPELAAQRELDELSTLRIERRVRIIPHLAESTMRLGIRGLRLEVEADRVSLVRLEFSHADIDVKGRLTMYHCKLSGGAHIRADADSHVSISSGPLRPIGRSPKAEQFRVGRGGAFIDLAGALDVVPPHASLILTDDVSQDGALLLPNNGQSPIKHATLTIPARLSSIRVRGSRLGVAELGGPEGLTIKALASRTAFSGIRVRHCRLEVDGRMSMSRCHIPGGVDVTLGPAGRISLDRCDCSDDQPLASGR